MPSTPRVYYQETLTPGAQVTLDRQASQHVLRVMRLRRGDGLIVFNGQGGEYEAAITSTAQGQAELVVGNFLPVDRESPVAVHLGQGLSRGERMDYAIQKAVEVGVASITPLFTERCNVKLTPDRVDKRMMHWEKVIISACEQSGRTKIPALHRPVALTDWLPEAPGRRLACMISDDPPTTRVSPIDQAVSLLIGPEGGLTTAECDAAKSQAFSPFSLGFCTLRTETAAPVAVALVLRDCLVGYAG